MDIFLNEKNKNKNWMEMYNQLNSARVGVENLPEKPCPLKSQQRGRQVKLLCMLVPQEWT